MDIVHVQSTISQTGSSDPWPDFGKVPQPTSKSKWVGDLTTVSMRERGCVPIEGKKNMALKKKKWS